VFHPENGRGGEQEQWAVIAMAQWWMSAVPASERPQESIII
jgi:hypothetical protein